MTAWAHRWIAIAGTLAILGAWWLGSLRTSPVVLPSPIAVAEAFRELAVSGLLLESIRMSAFRIGSGWLLGAAVGVPLGLLLGFAKPMRQLIMPYIEGLRYIPPIAFVSIFLIWFGTGELSKILLLFYTAVFIVTINTMAGVTAASKGSTWAARSLGASERQILVHVLLPQTVPYIYTGLRLALANTFITIVAVEMMSATAGVGYVIWSARDFMLTDQIFAGIIVVGLMGVAMDRVFHYSMKPLLSRFERA